MRTRPPGASLAGFAFVGLAVILLATFSRPAEAGGTAGTVSLRDSSWVAPTVDGRIGPNEWALASMYAFSAPPFSGALYIMNNDSEMYLAVRLTLGGSPVPLDRLIVDITFDNTNAGTFHDNMDRIEYCGTGDCTGAGVSSPGVDWNLVSVQGVCCYAFPDTLLGGTNDVVAAATSDGTYDYVELQHPLCSGDPNDFCLRPGSVVGFMLFIIDQGGYSGAWPSGLPSAWRHYRVGWASCLYPWVSPGFHRQLRVCLS